MSKARNSKAVAGPPPLLGGTGPKLIIHGHGNLQGRQQHGLRLKRDTMKRLRACVAGPDYLAVELAIRELCDRLEAQSGMRVVKAEELG